MKNVQLKMEEMIVTVFGEEKRNQAEVQESIPMSVNEILSNSDKVTEDNYKEFDIDDELIVNMTCILDYTFCVITKGYEDDYAIVDSFCFPDEF